MNPVELARQVADGEYSQEALEYISAALRDFFERGGGSLEDSLELSVARRKKFRNEALMRAASRLSVGREFDSWQIAGELEHALTRFDRLRDRHSREALGLLDRDLYDARNAGCEQINSRKSLAKLLMENF